MTKEKINVNATVNAANIVHNSPFKVFKSLDLCAKGKVKASDIEAGENLEKVNGLLEGIKKAYQTLGIKKASFDVFVPLLCGYIQNENGYIAKVKPFMPKGKVITCEGFEYAKAKADYDFKVWGRALCRLANIEIDKAAKAEREAAKAAKAAKREAEKAEKAKAKAQKAFEVLRAKYPDMPDAKVWEIVLAIA